MRIPRVTFEGAYHHVMNRGIEGKTIFPSRELKKHFLVLLSEQSKRTKVKLFAYCIMGNHYHLILKNSSGQMPRFMRNLNGQYGSLFRKEEGGKGYVFQDRYKSTLIQKDSYLSIAIIYTLLNPLRAGIVDDPYQYKWSSIKEYFSGCSQPMTETCFVEDIFGSKDRLMSLLEEWSGKQLPLKQTPEGEVLGAKEFLTKKEEVSDQTTRRQGEPREKSFQDPGEVIQVFEEVKDTNIDDIDPTCLEGKRLRSELLVWLKDRSGLTYEEIHQYPLFNSLSYSSLGKTYQRAKAKLQE